MGSSKARFPRLLLLLLYSAYILNISLHRLPQQGPLRPSRHLMRIASQRTADSPYPSAGSTLGSSLPQVKAHILQSLPPTNPTAPTTKSSARPTKNQPRPTHQSRHPPPYELSPSPRSKYRFFKRPTSVPTNQQLGFSQALCSRLSPCENSDACLPYQFVGAQLLRLQRRVLWPAGLRDVVGMQCSA
jgi:hypothetical protein